MYEIIHGHEDPAEPHRLKFLRLIDVKEPHRWRDAMDCMAGYVRQCIGEERKRRLRKSAREKLAKVAKLAGELIDVTGDDDVIDALKVLAPASIRGPDDSAGYEYLVSIKERALKARERISTTPGDRWLAADLGQPTARLLCAMMTSAAWKKVRGEFPSDGNQRAHEACDALWMIASGGASSGEDGKAARWFRYLHDARADAAHRDTLAGISEKLAASGMATDLELRHRVAIAFANARVIADECLALITQE